MPKSADRHQRYAIDHIPLPDTVKDACMPVPRDIPYVSHSVQSAPDGADKKPSGLNSQNHAFFIGKFISQTASEKIRSVLGWGRPDGSIYSEEFIKGALAWLFAHAPEGQKVRFVECRCLSELFNGPEDVQTAMTGKETVDMIYRIARKSFRRGKDQVEVISLEDEPLHQELFRVLRSSVNPQTRKADVGKALGGESRPLPKNPDSLDIAKVLYQAAQASEDFIQALRHAVPGKLRGREGAEHYVMAEIACRLAEILSGRFIHGGVSRQGMYDEVIAKIMKGEKGGYKNVGKLNDLFGLLKGRRFETLHLDTEENPYRLKKRRLLAQVRIALLAALTGAFGAGIFEMGVQKEKRRLEAIESLLRDEIGKGLKDISFYDVSFGGIHITDPDKKLNVFRTIVDRMFSDMEKRYRLPEDGQGEIKLLLKAYLLRHRHRLDSLKDGLNYPGNHFMGNDLLDQFVQENAAIFAGHGVEAGRPYGRLISALGSRLKTLDTGRGSSEARLHSENVPASCDASEWSDQRCVDIVDLSPFSGTGPGVMPHEKARKTYRYLGSFYSADGWSPRPYHFYLNAEGQLLAMEKEYGERSRVLLTARKADEGMRELLYDIRRHDLLPLQKFHQELMSLSESLYYQVFADPENPACREDFHELFMLRYNQTEYTDFLSGETFTVYQFWGYVKEQDRRVACVMAKGPRDERPNIDTAKRIAERYKAIMDGWYRQEDRFKALEEFDQAR